MKNVILYVGKFNLPFGTAAAQRVKENKKILQELRYDVKFVSTFENHIRNTEFENDFNVNSMSEIKWLIDISYLKEIVLEIGKENIHSIIFYNFPSVALYKANNYFKEMGILIFSDCTEWYGVPPKSSLIHKLMKTIDTEFRMRFVHKKLDGIICISRYLEKYYKSKGMKTVIIPNVIDLSDPKWASGNLRGDSHFIKFVYAGNPGKNFEKENLDLIVRVFNKLAVTFKNIKLEIIGIEEKYFSEIFYKRYKKMPDLERVYFRGRKTHIEVINIVKNSDYFIFFRPNTRANRAGFPTKLVESFGSNTPVITNDVGDVSEYIKNKQHGFILNTSDLSLLEKDLEVILNNHHANNTSEIELKRVNPFDYKNFKNDFKNFINLN